MRLAATVACAVALAAALASPAGALDYIALGDSIASGYGLSASAEPCYRTSGAYPRRVLAWLETRDGSVPFRSLACAGATAAGGAGPRSFARQVDAALRGLSGRPTLVTVTIGINDLDWWNLLRLAVLVRQPEAQFSAWLDGATASVRTRLAAQLRRLVARPATSVVVTGYYDPLNAESRFFESPLVCPERTRCRSRAARVIARLNGAIAAAAHDAGGPARIRFAPVAASFGRHRSPRPLCGGARPGRARTWIQDDCFHPNARGASAIATAVEHAIRRLAL